MPCSRRSFACSTALAACLAATSAAAWADGVLPTTTTGTPVVLGALDVGAVDAAVQPQLDALHRCTLQALKQQPQLYGLVAVKLKVHDDGSVLDAQVRGSTLDRPAAEACMARALADLRVSVLEGGRQAVAVVPVVLTPAPVITPRSRLQDRLAGCTDGQPAPAATTRTVLARVDVVRGRADTVELQHLAEVDPTAADCIRDALELGPHRMGTGPRFYQWDLPG